MKHPLLIRIVPDRFKQTVFYRLYNPIPSRFAPLLESAPLRFAPGTVMTGLVPGDVISGSIATTGFYELELSRRLAHVAHAGGRLVDVGANIGYFTLLWLAGNKNNTCVSVEASPRNVALIRQNLAANAMQDRCRVEAVAAGKERTKLSFDVGPENQTGWGGLASERSDRTIEVDVVRVDELVTDDTPIDVLKIDVEGADTWVVLGCEKLFQKKQIRSVFFELNKPRLRALGIPEDEALQFLKRLGYQVRVLRYESDGVVEYEALVG